MAKQIVNAAIKGIYTICFEEVRVRTINSIKDGDVSFGEFKDRLTTEFERINSKLNVLMDEPIYSAKTHLSNGLAYYSNGSAEEAMIHFRNSSNDAIKGFLQASTFEKKVLAMKLRMLTILHLNNYFDESIRTKRDLKIIRDLITIAWIEFLGLNEVKTAIRDEFEYRGDNTLSIESIFKKIVGSTPCVRRTVLAKVSSIKAFVEQIIETKPIINTVNDIKADFLTLAPTILSGHTDIVRGLVVEGNRLYSCSWDHTIKVWDISTDPLPVRPLMGTMEGHGFYVVNLLIFGGRLYSASSDKTIKVWDITTEEIPKDALATFSGHDSYCVTLAISTCGKRLYSGAWDNKIKVWDVSVEPFLTDPCVGTIDGHEGYVTALVVNSGRLFSGSWDKTIKCWDISSDIIPTTPIAIFTGHTDSIYCLSQWNGKLFSGSADKTIKCWDISESEFPENPLLTTFEGHSHWVNSVLSFNGRLFSGSGDHTIKCWDISMDIFPATHVPLTTLEGHSGWVVALCECGGKIYSGSADKTIHVRYH